MSKEASGNFDAVWKAWTRCGNCKQTFEGSLELGMLRCLWRCHRSSQDLGLRFNSSTALANCLGNNGEVDATSQLLDEASTCAGNDKGTLLDLNLVRAGMLIENGQNLEALGLLQAMLPEAKVRTSNPAIYCLTLLQTVEVLLDLERYQEAHEAATELVAFAKAKFGLEDPVTLKAMGTYARTCARVGRVEEAKANFEDVLTTQTRVLGREHPDTQVTLQNMRIYGFVEPSG